GEPATSQRRTGGAPVVETTVRVPGGEVVQHAYGAVVAAADVVVVEIENRSPVPLTVALVVRITRNAVVEIAGSSLVVDGRPVLQLSGTPRAWAAGASTVEIV